MDRFWRLLPPWAAAPLLLALALWVSWRSVEGRRDSAAAPLRNAASQAIPASTPLVSVVESPAGERRSSAPVPQVLALSDRSGGGRIPLRRDDERRLAEEPRRMIPVEYRPEEPTVGELPTDPAALGPSLHPAGSHRATQGPIAEPQRAALQGPDRIVPREPDRVASQESVGPREVVELEREPALPPTSPSPQHDVSRDIASRNVVPPESTPRAVAPQEGMPQEVVPPEGERGPAFAPAPAEEQALPSGEPIVTAEEAPGLLSSASEGSVERSRGLELAAREADARLQIGFELAGRGAHYSARADFIAALRLLSQALDAEQRTDRHRRSLAMGLAALREAQEFLPPAGRLEADLDLPTIIAGHDTPVLKGVEVRNLSPAVAMQSYFTFAQEQLAAAVGDEFAGSMALVGLGKLHGVMGERAAENAPAAKPKAMTYLQASVLVCRRNYMATNELGVLLAKAGRFEDAKTALEHSVSIRPSAAAWRNLHVVLKRVGRNDLAERARYEWAVCAKAEAARLGRRADDRQPPVQWMAPDAFAGTYVQPSMMPASRPSAPARSAGWMPGASAREILLCQALGPAAPCDVYGVDGSTCNWCRRQGWEGARAIFWQAYAQGEYVGHARLGHVAEYRLRVDDQLDMIYRVTREETSRPYRLNVGDEVRVESMTDAALTRDLILQPDGTITLRLLGQVPATGKTISQLRDELEKAYLKYYKVPAVTVTPLRVNTKLEDLRATVDRRAGVGGQSQLVRVTPEGTISLPAIGAVSAQNLSLPELQKELNERYREQVEGIEVIPVLAQRAPRYVYVLGEVRNPGRFELTGPTTTMQAISMAGGWNVGGNLRQIVVFRRGDDWRLLATMVNLHGALYGKEPAPRGEIWLSDSDVVVVPKHPILVADDFINLVFTRGIYGVFPLTASINFSKMGAL